MWRLWQGNGGALKGWTWNIPWIFIFTLKAAFIKSSIGSFQHKGRLKLFQTAFIGCFI
ncbi:hypothetical protein NEIFLAOT_00421 [Neisseria flavescens NRL30031/H210]|uniref:Uncharacterized protein n=1 Tax=Neisseria flavescens NRL30031/H210 TaxID=546264 RepID=C0EKH8_NEIFL|nr:hypothetical protein NEIFLAOT_00421 [Neisseria flavescens NRL30031/H210]